MWGVVHLDAHFSQVVPCLGGVPSLIENQIVPIMKRLDYLEFGGFNGGHVGTRKYDKWTDMDFVMDKVDGGFWSSI